MQYTFYFILTLKLRGLLVLQMILTEIKISLEIEYIY